MVKHTQTIRRLLPTNCLSVFDDFVGLALKWLKLLQRRIFIDDCAYSVLIYWFWNLRLLSFISSSVACRCTFKHVNPFGFPIFLSIGIWMLEIWRRHTVELSRNNSFISSFVTFVFKFTIYNSSLFCFSLLAWLILLLFNMLVKMKMILCLLWWCYCELLLEDCATSVRRNWGLSCSLVCYLANDLLDCFVVLLSLVS